MAHTVFICHSSNDKQVADAACAALEAQRIPCWIAPRDILAGEEYGKAIVDALASCQIVLLIFSGHANDSPQVRREIERAVSKGKIIVPFRIEDVMPSDAMEFALSNTHWLNALTPPLERYLLQLCDTISRLMQKHKEAEPPLWRPQEPVKETVVKPEPIAELAKVSPEPVNKDVEPRTPAPWWKRRSVIAGAVLVSILIVVTLSISLHRTRQTGPARSNIQGTNRLEIHAVIGGPYKDEQEAAASLGGSVPADQELKRFSRVMGGGATTESVYVLQRASVVAGNDFFTADPSINSNTGQREVQFTLTNEAGDKFYDYTSKNVGRSMAVVMNDHILEVATIQNAIRDRVEITGAFSPDEVAALSNLDGAQPASLDACK